MAAAVLAILDELDLCWDTFTHFLGVADYADLLALRRLQHPQRLYHRCQCLRVKGAKTLVNEKILEMDIP